MNLVDTFGINNEASKALNVHFVQKEIDYDYSISWNVLFNFLDNASLETNREFQ